MHLHAPTQAQFHHNSNKNQENNTPPKPMSIEQVQTISLKTNENGGIEAAAQRRQILSQTSLGQKT